VVAAGAVEGVALEDEVAAVVLAVVFLAVPQGSVLERAGAALVLVVEADEAAGVAAVVVGAPMDLAGAADSGPAAGAVVAGAVA
jgi:hypothetical protein